MLSGPSGSWRTLILSSHHVSSWGGFRASDLAVRVLAHGAASMALRMQGSHRQGGDTQVVPIKQIKAKSRNITGESSGMLSEEQGLSVKRELSQDRREGLHGPMGCAELPWSFSLFYQHPFHTPPKDFCSTPAADCTVSQSALWLPQQDLRSGVQWIEKEQEPVSIGGWEQERAGDN